MHDHYTYRVTWSGEDQMHIGTCIEFPSLSWLAETPDAALAGIRKVVADVLSDMHKSGEQIPEPLMEKYDIQPGISHISAQYLPEIAPCHTATPLCIMLRGDLNC